MARYLAAKARSEEMETRLKPIWDRLDAARPAYKITHVAKDGSSATYRMGPDDFALYDSKPGDLDGCSFLRPQIEAMKAQHRDFERLKREVGSAELGRLSNRYSDEEAAVEYALLNTPAPHMRAVEWKLKCYAEIAADSSLDPADLENILADLRRLAGEARA